MGRNLIFLIIAFGALFAFTILKTINIYYSAAYVLIYLIYVTIAIIYERKSESE